MKPDINFITYWGTINSQLQEAGRSEAIYNPSERFFCEVLENRGELYTVKKIGTPTQEIEMINSNQFLTLNDYLAENSGENTEKSQRKHRENIELMRRAHGENSEQLQTIAGNQTVVKQLLFGHVPAQTWTDYRTILEQISKQAAQIRRNTQKKETLETLEKNLKKAEFYYQIQDFKGLEKVSSKINVSYSSQKNMKNTRINLFRKNRIKFILKRILYSFISLATVVIFIFTFNYFIGFKKGTKPQKNNSSKQLKIDVDELINRFEKKANLAVCPWRRDIIKSNLTDELSENEVKKIIVTIAQSKNPEKFKK